MLGRAWLDVRFSVLLLYEPMASSAYITDTINAATRHERGTFIQKTNRLSYYYGCRMNVKHGLHPIVLPPIATSIIAGDVVRGLQVK